MSPTRSIPPNQYPNTAPNPNARDAHAFAAGWSAGGHTSTSSERSIACTTLMLKSLWRAALV